jgi:Mg-chelatase subunit ChlD
MIPLFVLSMWPYFRLPKKYRRSRNRITSMVIHLVIITLLSLVLSGMTIDNSFVSKKSDIIILIDQSKSQMRHEESITAFITSVIETLPDGYRVGIITFGNNQLYTSELSSNKEQILSNYLNQTTVIDASVTNIEDALLYASNQLDNVSNSRIILVSDGRETDGNALNAARKLSSAGARVDVKYITPSLYINDASISRVLVSNNPQRGENVAIQVFIDSDIQTLSQLSISYTSSNGTVVKDSIELLIQVGTTIHTFEHVFMHVGLTEIHVELDIDFEIDSVLENNAYYAFVDIKSEASKGILIIEGTLNEGQALENMITSNGYVVTRINTDILPRNISEMTQYQLIILVNIKNSDLTPTGFEALLNTYVLDFGGGLLTIGGDRAYQQQDMTGEGINRTFDQLLPVESNTDPKTMAVVIVMDASGSMTANGSNRFFLAKEGAKASVQALFDSKGDTTHMFGVVTFDANERSVIEMTSVNNIESIKQQIDAFTTGSGTRYINGLLKAREMLNDPMFVNSQKHIIFLTDGGPQDDIALYTSVLDSLRDISVSTISLGNPGENQLNPAIVEAMVRIYNNRGAFYSVTDASQLYNIMLSDTEQAQSGDFVNQKTFTGVFTSLIPAFSSISTMEPLDGYYGTRTKPQATMVVKTETDDPLYVEWRPRASSGKVGSFMSDLNGFEDGFSKTFVTNFIGRAFIMGMVKSLIPSVEVFNNQNVNVSYTHKNYESTVRIRTTLEDGETLRAHIISPDNIRTRLTLNPLSRTTFEGSFNRTIPGIYTLEVIKYARNGSIIGTSNHYSTFSYSKEYVNAFDEEETIFLMENIANLGKGQYLTDQEDLFSLEAETIRETIDPTIFFIIMSLSLFLLDIITRKFKFKWPHELLKKQALRVE